MELTESRNNKVVSGCSRNVNFRNCTGNWAMLLPKLPGYIGEGLFAGWTDQQAMKTQESIEEIKKLLSTGMFKGCGALVYDKDMVVIEIDPETGLLKENP